MKRSNLLDRHAGLRNDRDILVFDPVHCYGLPGYLEIFELLTSRGWPQTAFWPHGGHLFSLHVAAALELGGTESNPLCFRPFSGYADGMVIVDGVAPLPNHAGIGFEFKRDFAEIIQALRDATPVEAVSHPHYVTGAAPLPPKST